MKIYSNIIFNYDSKIQLKNFSIPNQVSYLYNNENNKYSSDLISFKASQKIPFSYADYNNAKRNITLLLWEA